MDSCWKIGTTHTDETMYTLNIFHLQNLTSGLLRRYWGFWKPFKCVSSAAHNVQASFLAEPHVAFNSTYITQLFLLTMRKTNRSMLIYICMRVPTAHRDAHIYMHTVQTSTYRAELHSQTRLRVNPCLLSSNNSRPHLSTYIITRKRPEGAVLVREANFYLTHPFLA